MKEPLAFQIAMLEVQKRDSRYAPEAYAFVCDSLAHTVKTLGRDKSDDHHVSGQELLKGFRNFALLQFGPLATLVMHEWGVQANQDVGNMVYNLIETNYFGKNQNDKIEDFSDDIALTEFLSKPYQKKPAID